MNNTGTNVQHIVKKHWKSALFTYGISLMYFSLSWFTGRNLGWSYDILHIEMLGNYFYNTSFWLFLCQKYGAIHCVFNSKFIVDIIQNNKTTFLFYCLVVVSPVFPPTDCIKIFYSARKSMENKYLFYVWALHYLTEEY